MSVKIFFFKFLNKILNTNQKLFVAGKLSNTARLFVEASFISHSQHELNGEEFWLKYSTLKFKNVIDAGIRGDWTSSLLSTRKEVEHIVLIEPNEDRAQDLKKRFQNEPRSMIIKTALDYREDTLDLHFKEKEDTHARLQFSSCDLDDDNLIVQKTKTNTLDNIIEKLPFKRIDLLKLDLEGFDHYALLGARKHL